MEVDINKMSYSDLKLIHDDLESSLESMERWVNEQRGYSYDLWVMRNTIYEKDDKHEKLRRVKERMKEIIENI